MLAQEALQRALMNRYCELKSRNGAFSVRAYARRLDMNSGVLSSILNGKRRLSPKQICKVAERLDLSPHEEEGIKALAGMGQLLKAKPAYSETVLQLRSDQFHLIADGIHFALLSLMETTDFSSDPEWIADRLGESVTRVAAAIDRLERMHLIQRKRGKLVLLQARTTSGDGPPDAAIKKYHEDRLEEAKEKLRQVDQEDRDFFSTTLAVNRAQLPLARSLLRDYKKKLARVLEEGTKDEVYRISFQLFPVTRIRKRTKE